ncbi:hypothetical protein SpCBS45565_g01949 [Spizellomyces sp. 'palustris']|nr:hypothetical protein SpCBS45565_g01949 [Spizellomyces sp. 'palustris']
MGPAGSGKSTYCSTIMTHCETIKRTVHLVNLDPAAERFTYEPSIGNSLGDLDREFTYIRDLITLEDVQEELGYGPNGGLIYCLEFLTNNLDFLEEELGEHDDDYLIVDCPGQIELYTHFPIMKTIVQALQRLDYRVCGVYLLDSQFVEDPSKFFAGVMSAMSAMVQLEIPHINVMTKMDLIDKRHKTQDIERYLYPDPTLLLEDVNQNTRPKFRDLNEALIDEYNMVTFVPLNIKDEESVELVLSHVDNAIQYGEDAEPKEPKDMDFEGWEGQSED